MTHWKLIVAYDGREFHGWQIQPDLTSIQGTLAEALAHITGEQVLPQGAGRTDAGVHALAQVCSFSLQTALPAKNLLRALNRVLPPAIRVLAAENVLPGFHARHSSMGKLYEYRIFERRVRTHSRSTANGPVEERTCSPFLAPYVWDCRWLLELEPMEIAAQQLIGTQDFSAMAAHSRPPRQTDEVLAGSSTAASTPNPVKTIHTAHWVREQDLLIFRIRGSGFLHHMVRNLVGTMVDIGRGRLGAADMSRILSSRNRSLAGPTAPASGLYLVEVLYPASD